jgi:nitronate monooxygenase
MRRREGSSVALDPDWFARLTNGLALPLICAPMTGASGPELVAAASRSGIAAAFPTRNCASAEEVESWLAQIREGCAGAGRLAPAGAPIGVNLIIRDGTRLAADLEAVSRQGVGFAISSVGSPERSVALLHDAGIPVFADVASLRHVRNALAAGADGLVLLTAGAGGHTGWANPFAFARAVRTEYDGPLVLAGGVSDGRALWSAIVLGFDLAYMGTRFLATHESRVPDGYKQAVLAASLDDIELAPAPNGIAASLIRGGGGSAGHAVSGATELLSVRDVVSRTTAEWDAARDETARMLHDGVAHRRRGDARSARP